MQAGRSRPAEKGWIGMALSPEDIKKVKGQGFLQNRGTENFSGRIITRNGVLTAAQVANLAQAAETFGNGTVAFTSRLTLEVPGIAYENIPAFQEFVGREGMVTGGTGSKVRPVVSCKGTTCVFGLIDTQGLAAEIHQRFYEGYRHVTLPHKFKIAVGGCPNNCVKPDLNDLGIVGQRVPACDPAACRSCKKCGVVETCPMKAAAMEDGKIAIDRSLCNNCGRCAGKCPFGSVKGSESMYKVYVGGRWGKQIRIGTPLSRLFTRDEVLDVVEKAILLYKSKGLTGERFGSTVERLGVEKVEKMLVADNLLRRKEEILETETVGGASC